MEVEWDPAKAELNLEKHSLSFEEAAELFSTGVDYLEIFDTEHLSEEDRFICIGPIVRGLVLDVMTEREGDRIRIISARFTTPTERLYTSATRLVVVMDNEIPELTEEQFMRSIPARIRARFVRGEFRDGQDVVMLRRFTGLTQVQFAQAMGISVHTLRNWEQGRRKPEGPALSLLRVAARHPRILWENLEEAA